MALLAMAAARGTRSGLAATTAALACAAWARGGFSVNHMDIAPGQAGLLMGVSNTAGTLAGTGVQDCKAPRSCGMVAISLCDGMSNRAVVLA